MPDSPESRHQFGFITLAGPPNAGKSTLLNKLVGQKISIISRRPQTTRHRILGIRTAEDSQLVFVDTPGIHNDEKKNLNKMINRTAINSLSDVDLIVFMIDYKGWTELLERTLKKVTERAVPILLVINKIDALKDKTQLLPLIQKSSRLHAFVDIVPISALTMKDVESFVDVLLKHIPIGPPGFPADQVSDRGDRFLISELVREQTFLLLGNELPYESAVEVTGFDRSDSEFWILDMIIWVEKSSQKSIVIGKGGQQLKLIGQRARYAIEKEFGVRARLNLWVKERKGWADNTNMLRSLGYVEE
ncbi:MAG: GTPase Era [Acidiferrobacterales bacterium]|nr:GTPase Era [Acidiferrobacterales bacterium]